MSLYEILFSFKGRIGRATFWAVIIPLAIVSVVLQVALVLGSEGVDTDDAIALAILAIMLGGFILWIGLATYTKRWHDLDKSGWMNLTLFIPLVNIFIVLFLGCAPGTAESNRYGEVNPRQYAANKAAFSLFRKASWLDVEGNFEEALSLYQEIAKTFPDGPLARNAEIRIQELQEGLGDDQATRSSTYTLIRT